MIKMDLSKFEHDSSDEKTTTLKHKKDGHKITLVHKALKPEHQEALKALAANGKDDKNKKESKAIDRPIKEPKANAGEVKQYADGGDVRIPMGRLADPSGGQDLVIPAGGVLGQMQRERANGLALESQMQHNPEAFPYAQAANLENFTGIPNEVAGASASLPTPTPQAAPESVVAQQGMAPADLAAAPTQAAAQTNAADPAGEAEGVFRAGYNQKLAGINQAANAAGALGQQKAAVLEQSIADKQKAVEHYDEQYRALNDELQAARQDVLDGHIDPNQYWTGDKNGNGGHSKIMAGIGMILAGFNPASGGSGQNAAVNFIKYQMEQNLQAQAKNLDSKNNLLSATMKQFGNLREATEMTRIMQNDMVAHQLEMAAQKAQSPMAKAAAMQAAGEFKTQAAGQLQNFAMRRAMMSMAANTSGDQSGNDGAIRQGIAMMRMVNPTMAKDMEERYVPGMGIASVPVPDSTRQKLFAFQDVDRGIREALQFAKQHAGSLDPKIRAQASTMMNELQSKIRTAESQGVYKESEAHFMTETMGGSPADFLAKWQTVPKLQQMLHTKSAEAANLAKGYGLKPQDPIANLTPQAQKAVMMARQNPNNPQAKKILEYYGLQH